jgi:hypothetical protein
LINRRLSLRSQLCAATNFLADGLSAERALNRVFPLDPEHKSYWENGDYVLLGRAPADRLLERAAWEFWTSSDANGPRWSRNEEEAAPVFRFDKMTGENHISYAAPLKRYLGNLTRRASRPRTISFPGRRAPIEASSIFSKPPRCGAPDRCSIATTRGERTGTTSQCFQ